MSVSERIARFGDRLFDRMRDKRAFTLTEADAVDGDLEPLRGQAYALLVTFRRDGTPVPSPVWLGVDGEGRAYVKTAADVGKVKRIRRDGRALIAPSNSRGKPTGPALRATARMLPKDDWAHAESVLDSAYGTTRRVFGRVLGGPEDAQAYIEITPR